MEISHDNFARKSLPPWSWMQDFYAKWWLGETAEESFAWRSCAAQSGPCGQFRRLSTPEKIKNLIPRFGSKNIRDADANGTNLSLILQKLGRQAPSTPGPVSTVF